jgi:phosphomannomutase/phosphoglucomutase
MSGHFFFADRYFGYDDGIYAALRILEIVSEQGRSVAELLADLPERSSTPEIRVPCPDTLKFQVVDRAKRHFEGKAKLTEIDGVRITFEDGSWGLVRASNTGPLLVVRCEAPSPARLQEVQSTVQTVIDQMLRELGAA